MPSANVSFTFSFSILIPFVSFPCQTAVARASDTMLKKGGESGNPCPIHDLTEDAFSFSPHVSRVLVICGLFNFEVYSLSTHVIERSYPK